MTKETLAKIEAALRDARAVDHKDKAKLVHLLEQLKSELESERRAHLLDSFDGRLTELAAGLEVEHPKLAAVVNEVSSMLAKIGI